MAGEFLAQLPEDLRTNEAFTGYATLGDFAKAHLEAQGKLKEFDGKVKEYEGKVTDLTGKLSNSIPKLPEKATDEEKEVYYLSLGKPEKPTDYEIPLAEGQTKDNPVIQWAQNTFHAAHLTKEQAKFVGEEFNKFTGEVTKIENEKRENLKKETEVKLKTEWGNDFDKNLELTKRAFKKFTDSELDNFFKEDMKGPVGNHPLLIKFIYAVGKAMGDDISPKGSITGQQTGPPKLEYPDMRK